jgi:putative heme transporter
MARLHTRLTGAATRIPTRALRIGVVFAAMALLAGFAFRSRSLLSELGRLHQPDPRWLLLAVLAQIGSLIAYALIVRELLRGGDVTARIVALLRATLGGIAMTASLPAGAVASTGYWYKLLRQEGAGRSLAASAMVGSMLAGLLSLACLFVAGVVAAGGQGPLSAVRLPILAGWAGTIVLAVALKGRLGGAATRLIRRLAPGLPAGYTLQRGSLLGIGLFAFANWLLDCGCLYIALHAMHASVPLQGILLTYTLAQLVASLPLLPGGGGTVEASLLIGFAAFHHTSGNVLAGVLLYRLICCWGLAPVGWFAVLVENHALLRLRVRLTALTASL